MNTISIIVPCFNEEEALPLFYEEIKKIFANELKEFKLDLILVDDGSSDGTLSAMKKIAEDEEVTYLSFSRNFGKEAAMYAGFCNANGDYVAVMDADMQDPPSLLPEMVRIIESGEYDCIAAKRNCRSGESFVRSWLSKCFYKIINKISDIQFVDGARDFRLIKRNMADIIVAMGEQNRFLKGIFEWIGFKTYWISYDNVDRIAGSTKWNIWGLMKYAIDGIINYSSLPLTIASSFGFGMTGISFILLIAIIIRRLVFGDPVIGWASTACLIIFIGGIQLFSVGILGQYISKTYIETKKRPHYIIAESNKDSIKKM